MDEQKSEVVEKRLSKGVIRRRSRRVTEEKPKQEESKPKKLSLDDSASAKPAPKAAAEESQSKPVAKEDAVEKKRLVLEDKDKKSAEEIVRQNLRKKITLDEPKQEAKSEEKTVEAKPKKVSEKKEAKPERKKVLSFKDRVKGTIDLKKIQPSRPEPKESEDAEDRAKRFRNSPAPKEDSAAEKTPRTKRGVKNIGGDLDIEGRGRATDLGQFVRAAPDRIFRPGSSRNGPRKKKIISKKNIKQTQITEKKASKRVIQIDQSMTVGNLAQELGIKAGDIIKQLMELGTMATINQEIDKETVAIIAAEYSYEIRDTSFKEADVLAAAETQEEDLAGAPSRPPVVTVMGHVDHGKTSLLDAIRSTNVTRGEAGGITQHIGAYTVELPQGKITFLDTPGHEAFTTMRARGANVTDIVILVVAADDGLMPQTEESIDHARAAGVPIIVAVNKIDKEEANPDKVKRQLSEKGILTEDWGGDVMCNHVSALKKEGIKELLESVLLQAEVMELKAIEEAPAKGTVIEARLDKGRGPVCTVLVQSGTLAQGDYLVAGSYSGRVKALQDWQGDKVQKGGPSMALEVLGLENVPEAGDEFHVVASEQDAKKVAEHRRAKRAQEEQEARKGVSLEDMFSQMKAGEVSELNIILKTDVHGSLEAVRDAILKIGNEEVKPNIIHTAVGGVNESDVRLAMASNAVIIGFNVRPETKALHLAKDQGVDIKSYKVIYDLVNEVKLAMEGLLAPEIKENYLGRAEVRQAFEVSKIGFIAGSMVVDGLITRNANLRLLRDNVVIHEGKVMSLKRFKDDAKEVKQGFECGIGIEGYKDIKAGDVIEAFELQEIKKTL
ncbi:MAG: translation initiation factor IF-2 [Deltaproteobacteria bacterium]|nr:translation initiation factor IF-2 [Deltaproteobacteria bacterium]